MTYFTREEMEAYMDTPVGRIFLTVEEGWDYETLAYIETVLPQVRGNAPHLRALSFLSLIFRFVIIIIDL